MDSRLKYITNAIQEEWDLIPDGYFFKLREGIMDEDRHIRVLDLLKEARNIIKNSNEKVIDREFVKVVWFIPIFMIWQEDRISKLGDTLGEVYRGQWCPAIENIVSEILGEP